MPLSDAERDRILEIVANIYASGYTEGIDLVVSEYDVRHLIPKAAVRMPKALEMRLNLVEESIGKYLDAIERHAVELQTKGGLTGDQLMHQVTEYTKGLTARHSEIVTQTEYAKGRMDGATAVMDETGVEYEFRFPHFDIMTPGHEVCAICEAIAIASPYTPDEAEAQGYPDVPHPNCDHGWVIVPKGEITRTEEHPMGPAELPAHLL